MLANSADTFASDMDLLSLSLENLFMLDSNKEKGPDQPVHS